MIANFHTFEVVTPERVLEHTSRHVHYRRRVEGQRRSGVGREEPLLEIANDTSHLTARRWGDDRSIPAGYPSGDPHSDLIGADIFEEGGILDSLGCAVLTEAIRDVCGALDNPKDCCEVTGRCGPKEDDLFFAIRRFEVAVVRLREFDDLLSAKCLASFAKMAL